MLLINLDSIQEIYSKEKNSGSPFILSLLLLDTLVAMEIQAPQTNSRHMQPFFSHSKCVYPLITEAKHL